VEVQLDVVQRQREQGLQQQGELLEQQRLEQQRLERQGVLLELEQRRLAWPRWHRRNRRRL
jgi:hypothetical protein